MFKGENLNGGLVGNYVVIEGEKFGFIGRTIELSLPEKERLELSERSFKNKDFHPTGKIEILLSFDLYSPDTATRGLNALPAIGAKVFVCSSEFIKTYFRKFGVSTSVGHIAPVFELGKLTYDSSVSIEISQQGLFGRHCAIVGTTGGGKSYTVSKLIEGIISNGGKVILLDATGEYSEHDLKDYSCAASKLSSESFFHYTNLTISDLFLLLRPSGQVQAPKLVEAIKSLKIVKILDEVCEEDEIITKSENGYSILIDPESGKREEIVVKSGLLVKSKNLMRPVNRVYYKYIDKIESLEADFDIKLLGKQVANEAIYDIDIKEHNKWGGSNPNHLSNCISLILRINNLVTSKLFDNIFGFNKEKDDNFELITRIIQHLNGDKQLMRIGFEEVGFEFQAREIVANAIGKFLLEKARSGAFKAEPIVLFLDEAHQYLNKSVKDEFFEVSQLNSFDLIAKECRKHGLFLSIASQMPRDIPIGTLSQIGTFIVHRLINFHDKEAIANASSSANRSTLNFLPVLGAGEAILMGVDFPMPVMLKINIPTTKPRSETPNFKVK